MPERAAAGKIAPGPAPREDPDESHVESVQRTRVVLLGASNLTLAFPLVVARLRALFPGPLEVLAAIGHGRSYGKPSRVLFRELPGIAECGLWRALEAGPPRETFALLADFGNDIVYGSEVDEIAGWIERDLARLGMHGARTVVVRPPLTSVDRLSPLRFRVARSLIFPSHRIDLATVRDRVRELDGRLVAMARAREAAIVEQPGSWYGFDPIHIRKARRGEAWEAFLSAFGREPARGASKSLPRADRRALWGLRPERRRWMGREQTHRQPCAELLDGTTIALY
jgi:hypothetical protein